MKRYEHLRKKAVELRRKGMALPDICARLKKSKTTVYYWVRDLEVEIERDKKKGSKARKAAASATKKRYRLLREEAYNQGLIEAPELFGHQTFRDFVILYMTEGLRKGRHQVSFVNSEPLLVRVANFWIRRLTSNKMSYYLQYHKDQDPDKLRRFWSKLLGVKRSEIGILRKSNSSELSGRQWASEYGVLTVRTCDTYLKCKLEAWMEEVRGTMKEGVLKENKQGVAQFG